MKRFHLSPVTFMLVSLSLVVGILVSGLTNSDMVPAAKAQSGSPAAVVGTPVRSIIMVASSAVTASHIVFRGVDVNGVATDGVVGGNNVQVVDGVIVSGIASEPEGVIVSGVVSGGAGTDGVLLNGVIVSGDPIPPVNGVIVSGDPGDPEGVIVSGDPIEPVQGVIVSGITGSSDEIVLTGGVLQGDNVSVVGGVIHGDNLRIAGAVISARVP